MGWGRCCHRLSELVRASLGPQTSYSQPGIEVGRTREIKLSLSQGFQMLQRQALDRFALLVIDDIGYDSKDEAETSGLFELVDHSTIIQINGENYRRQRARRLAP